MLVVIDVILHTILISHLNIHWVVLSIQCWLVIQACFCVFSVNANHDSPENAEPKRTCKYCSNCNKYKEWSYCLIKDSHVYYNLILLVLVSLFNKSEIFLSSLRLWLSEIKLIKFMFIVLFKKSKPSLASCILLYLLSLILVLV